MNETSPETTLRNPVARLVWLLLGLASLATGVLGIFLPLLPHTVFFLLAAFAFARSSERLHNWMITHPRLGPPILDWRRYGAISTRAKTLAMVMILATFLLSLALAAPEAVIIAQAVVLPLVSLFILTRPAPPAA